MEKEIFNERNSILKEHENDDFIPTDTEIDYGKPILADNFFQSNPLYEFSAQRLVYSCLLNPEIEKRASDISNALLGRGRTELETIEKTDEFKKLIDIMKNKPDPLNQERLKEKILNQKELAVPFILKELKKPQNDVFVELGLKIIYQSGINSLDEIIDLIKFGERRAYVISLLCILLGFFENKKSEKVLWDYFHCFKEYLPDKNYSDGPLLGLIELREKAK